ncbi:MAG: hypothetical protein RB191_04805 [Terriglobia bacterium]|jgi:hypothetical protein|nr:hypothetical protein [Terriglobia bacterium]
MFGLLRRSKTAKSQNVTYSLSEAAQQALDIASRERWPLLHLAGLAVGQSAQYWFATNLLEIVDIQGRAPGTTQNETLARSLRRDLTLNEDMDALTAAGEVEPRFVDLSVTGTELKKYLEWARTVQ